MSRRREIDLTCFEFGKIPPPPVKREAEPEEEEPEEKEEENWEAIFDEMEESIEEVEEEIFQLPAGSDVVAEADGGAFRNQEQVVQVSLKQATEALERNSEALRTADGLRITSFNSYAAGDDTRQQIRMAWMQRQREEQALITTRPRETEHLNYLLSLRQSHAFVDEFYKRVSETGLRLDQGKELSWEHVELMLQEPIPGRDRPCVNERSCVALQLNGGQFILRELLDIHQLTEWRTGRDRDPENASKYLPPHAQACYLCELCAATMAYVARKDFIARKGDTRNPYLYGWNEATQQFDTSITRITVRAGQPGQFDPNKCLLGEKGVFVGLTGLVPVWNPADYTPSRKVLTRSESGREAAVRCFKMSEKLLFRGGVMSGSPLAERGDYIR